MPKQNLKKTQTTGRAVNHRIILSILQRFGQQLTLKSFQQKCQEKGVSQDERTYRRQWNNFMNSKNNQKKFDQFDENQNINKLAIADKSEKNIDTSNVRKHLEKNITQKFKNYQELFFYLIRCEEVDESFKQLIKEMKESDKERKLEKFFYLQYYEFVEHKKKKTSTQVNKQQQKKQQQQKQKTTKNQEKQQSKKDKKTRKNQEKCSQKQQLIQQQQQVQQQDIFQDDQSTTLIEYYQENYDNYNLESVDFFEDQKIDLQIQESKYIERDLFSDTEYDIFEKKICQELQE